MTTLMALLLAMMTTMLMSNTSNNGQTSWDNDDFDGFILDDDDYDVDVEYVP